MKMIMRTIASLGLVAAFASVGQAQYLTDAGSPLGAGAGLAGAVTSYVTTHGTSFDAGSRRTLIALLAGGSPAPFAQMLGGGAQASALAEALGALGAQANGETFVAAVRAWNAYKATGTYLGSRPSYGAASATLALLTNMGARLSVVR